MMYYVEIMFSMDINGVAESANVPENEDDWSPSDSIKTTAVTHLRKNFPEVTVFRILSR